MAETGIHMIRTCILIVLIWLVSTKFSYSVEPSWVGKRKFDGEPTGIIRDIQSRNNSLYIGAENGLFHVVGASSKRYSANNSPLGKGYITGLHLIEDRLYIAEYGNGLFVFSVTDKSFKKVPIPEPHDKKVWAVNRVGGNLIVSTITEVLIVSEEDEAKPIIINKLQDGSELRGIYSIAEYQNEILVAESNHLIYLDRAGAEIKTLDRDTEFPELERITYVDVVGRDIYVGGVGGVYKVSDDVVTYYSIESSKSKLRDVESILIDDSSNLWVGAGGLYLLDKEDNKLKEITSGAPRFGYDQIRAVQSIHQLKNKEILIASTQLGLIELNQASLSLTYPHKSTFPFRKDIYSLTLLSGNNYLAKTVDEWLVLDAESGQLTALSNSGFDNEPLHRKENMIFSSETCEEYRIQTDKLISVQKVSAPSDFCQHIKPISYIKDSKQYLYYETPSHAGFVTLEENEIKYDANAPKSIRFLIGGENQPVIMMDNKGTLFIQEQKGVWVKQELSELNDVYVYCLYSDKANNYLYLCTSGRGLKRYNIKTRELTDAFPAQSVPRFIRDGFLDPKGNHWLATNKGFVLVNENYQFEFERSDGIVDTDFNYGGILPMTESSFLMVGDQLSYIIETNKLIDYVESRREHLSSASILASQARFGRRKLIDVTLGQGEVNFERKPEEIAIEFASSDFAYSHLHHLEYRMLGLHEEWHYLPTNIGSVAYSGLGPGQFDFQVRVIDEKATVEQPITEFSFIIPTPWWQTWVAYIVYFCLFIFACWGGLILHRQRVAEKSQILAGIISQKQAALIESNRSITDLLQKKERMFNNLAHEIRTPLMMIVWPIMELRAQHLTKDVREKLNDVFVNASRLRSIIEQIRTVEKIDNINTQTDYTYNIDETIRFIIDALRPTAVKKQQALLLDCHIKQPVILITDSLESMLNPLIINALSYSQERAQIKVCAKFNENQLVISVSDNGPGMSMEQVDFLLSRFQQAANYRGRPDYGIGLNLVNQLAVANEGWVEINSEEDKGTVITLHLPLKVIDESESTPSDEESVTAQAAMQVAEAKLDYTSELPVVLIVDSSVDTCEYLVNALTDYFNCYDTQSGKKALELIPILQPNLVISEMALPGMNGIELTEKIRELPENSDLPVIVLTAQTDQEVRINALKAAVNDYLIKPVERQELVLRIENQLRLSKLAHSQQVGPKPEGEKSEYLKTILPKCNTERERAFILKFLNVIERNYPEETFNRSEAASQMAMSERQLNRTMAKLMPDNFTLFLKKYRLEKSLQMLENGHQITTIALEVGFGSATYYSRCFKQEYGCLPTQMKFEREYDTNS